LIRQALRLCRLYYAIPMSLAYTLTLYYACGGGMAGRWAGAILSTAALATVIAGAYVLNDVFDLEVDRGSPRRHPIAAGKVSRRDASVLAALLLAGGLGVAAMCRASFLVCLAAVAAGLALYDFLSKHLGAGKQIFVAALITSIYPLALTQAGGATGSRAATLAVFPVWMFLTSFGYEVLKDLRDRSTDPQIAGRPTLIRRRPVLWRRISAGVVAVASLLLIVPAFLGCRWVYMTIAAVAMALAMVASFVKVRLAIRLVYAECLLVGIAAAADVAVFGM